MQDIYENIGEYNPERQPKVFENMISDMINKKKLIK